MPRRRSQLAARRQPHVRVTTTAPGKREVVFRGRLQTLGHRRPSLARRHDAPAARDAGPHLARGGVQVRAAGERIARCCRSAPARRRRDAASCARVRRARRAGREPRGKEPTIGRARLPDLLAGDQCVRRARRRPREVVAGAAPPRPDRAWCASSRPRARRRLHGGRDRPRHARDRGGRRRRPPVPRTAFYPPARAAADRDLRQARARAAPRGASPATCTTTHAEGASRCVVDDSALAQVAPTPAEIAAYTGLFAAAAKGDTATIAKLAADGRQRQRQGRARTHAACTLPRS